MVKHQSIFGNILEILQILSTLQVNSDQPLSIISLRVRHILQTCWVWRDPTIRKYCTSISKKRCRMKHVRTHRLRYSRERASKLICFHFLIPQTLRYENKIPMSKFRSAKTLDILTNGLYFQIQKCVVLNHRQGSTLV